MTFGDFSTQIIMPVLTLAAVVAAVHASRSANRAAAKRDEKNREVAAYERWVEQFFKLGQLSVEARPIRRQSLQTIKSQIEVYRAHLANTHSLEVAGAFSEHASRALQLHEIAEFLAVQDCRRKTKFGAEQIGASPEWVNETWYNDYRTFIRALSNTMSKVSAGLLRDEEASKEILKQDKDLSAKYPRSFDLIKKIEDELGTLGAL